MHRDERVAGMSPRDRDEADALLEHARTAFDAGDARAAWTDCERAAALARVHGDAELMARAAVVVRDSRWIPSWRRSTCSAGRRSRCSTRPSTRSDPRAGARRARRVAGPTSSCSAHGCGRNSPRRPISTAPQSTSCVPRAHSPTPRHPTIPTRSSSPWRRSASRSATRRTCTSGRRSASAPSNSESAPADRIASRGGASAAWTRCGCSATASPSRTRPGRSAPSVHSSAIR